MLNENRKFARFWHHSSLSRGLVQKRTSREWFLGLGLGLELGLGLGYG